MLCLLNLKKNLENIYNRAKDEVGYTAKRFLDMHNHYRGVKTASLLVNASRPSDGYTGLWMRKRLDLTVETLVIQDKWKPLFEPDEIERAKNRLREYEYEVKFLQNHPIDFTGKTSIAHAKIYGRGKHKLNLVQYNNSRCVSTLNVSASCCVPEN